MPGFSARSAWDDLFLDAREKDIETQAAQAETPPNQPTTELPAVNTIWLMGILSVALAIGNLLPFPALDGGRIAFSCPKSSPASGCPLNLKMH